MNTQILKKSSIRSLTKSFEHLIAPLHVGLSSLFFPSHVCYCLPLYIIMVNLMDALVNDVFKLNIQKSSSSTRLENPEFVELLHYQNFPTSVLGASHGTSGLRLYSSGDDCDSLMSDTTICAASLARVKCSSILFGLK